MAHKHEITDRLGELNWKRPSYASIYRVLTNPAYRPGPLSAEQVGRDRLLQLLETRPLDIALVLGVRTLTARAAPRLSLRRKPREQWFSFIPDTRFAA